MFTQSCRQISVPLSLCLSVSPSLHLSLSFCLCIYIYIYISRVCLRNTYWLAILNSKCGHCFDTNAAKSHEQKDWPKPLTQVWPKAQSHQYKCWPRLVEVLAKAILESVVSSPRDPMGPVSSRPGPVGMYGLGPGSGSHRRLFIDISQRLCE